MNLIFIHGAGFGGDSFAAQQQAFPDAHFPNLPGHLCPGQPGSIPEFAEFIETYARSNGLNDAVLCGHSMGGAVALETVLRARASVRGVVLLGSGAKLRVAPAMLEQLRADYQAAVAQIVKYFFADPAPERLQWAAEWMERIGAAQTLRDFQACDTFDAVERLGEVSVPLLALTGDSDKMTPPKLAAAVADRVPGATARIIPGAGHFLMVERAAETNAEIGAFLAGLP